MMSDLRNSGRIEQDADIILFPYRPEYYDIMEDAEGVSLKGKLEVIQAKARMGELKSYWFDYVATHDSYLDELQPATPFPVDEPAPAPAHAIPPSSRPGKDEDIPF